MRTALAGDEFPFRGQGEVDERFKTITQDFDPYPTIQDDLARAAEHFAMIISLPRVEVSSDIDNRPLGETAAFIEPLLGQSLPQIEVITDDWEGDQPTGNAA